MAASVTCPKLHWFPSNYIHPYQPSLSTGPKVGAMKNENTLGIPNTMAREAEEQHVSFTSADVDCELFIESLMSMYIYIFIYLYTTNLYKERLNGNQNMKKHVQQSFGYCYLQESANDPLLPSTPACAPSDNHCIC